MGIILAQTDRMRLLFISKTVLDSMQADRQIQDRLVNNDKLLFNRSFKSKAEALLLAEQLPTDSVNASPICGFVFNHSGDNGALIALHGNDRLSLLCL